MARREPSRVKTGAGPARSHQALRISGGDWRGRRLNFPIIEGLRPSLAQNRERLFNWLQYDIAGRSVLDAFAGSGILGLEALSRRAGRVDFVERNAQAAQAIRSHMKTLQASGQVHQADFFQWLQQAEGPYELVLLDPPFADMTFQRALDAVAAASAVADGALVYLETPAGFAPQWPTGWVSVKHARKGRIEQHVWRARHGDSTQEQS